MNKEQEEHDQDMPIMTDEEKRQFELHCDRIYNTDKLIEKIMNDIDNDIKKLKEKRDEYEKMLNKYKFKQH